MKGSLLEDGFGHHVWATMKLLDVCQELPPEQLDTAVPGTYGSIIDTMRHVVGADVWYQHVLTERRTPRVETEDMDLAALRHTIELVGAEWSRIVADDLDPNAVVVAHRSDGSQSEAPLTIRLAQALHHGTDHRSQICTALTSLGIEPPEIDVWAFAWEGERLKETPAPSSPGGGAAQ